MKKTKLFGWAFVASMMSASFSACSNDAEEVLAQESEIRLTSEITPSRVTSLDYQSTQIVEGQQVGVTITGAKSEHNNVAWSVGEDGALSNIGDEIYYGNGTATITAYHPYNSAWTSTSHTFSVSTDQSVEANYLASDLLWATNSSSKTEEAVSLTFAHKLAKINVTLESDDIEDLSGASIYICGTNIKTDFNPTTGALSDATTTNIEEIKAGVTTSDAHTASAIVVPQTIKAGTQFIRIAHGDKVYYYKLGSEDKELKAGYSCNYTLKVKDREISLELKSANITNWLETEENIGEMQEEDLSWFNPNQYITYVTNYEMVQTNDDASKPDLVIYRSYVDLPSLPKANKIEYKFQIEEISSSHKVYLNNNAPYLDTNGLSFGYSWSELGVNMTDCIILSYSNKDKILKVNEKEFDYKAPSSNYNIKGDYLFTDYYRDYDDGWLTEWTGNPPAGSKLYYVKIWDENDNLIYLGAASIALNSKTNKEECCWKSYAEGEYWIQFAHYPTKTENYQPYGGGIDE